MQPHFDDVLDVLSAISEQLARTAQVLNIYELRRNAIRSVADSWLKRQRFKNRNSAEKSIHDACVRRLSPAIPSVRKFDSLIEQWINGKANSLREALEPSAASPEQRQRLTQILDSVGLPRKGKGTRPRSRIMLSVSLEPDLAALFPTAVAVRSALRALARIIRDHVGPKA